MAIWKKTILKWENNNPFFVTSLSDAVFKESEKTLSCEET